MLGVNIKLIFVKVLCCITVGLVLTYLFLFIISWFVHFKSSMSLQYCTYKWSDFMELLCWIFLCELVCLLVVFTVREIQLKQRLNNSNSKCCSNMTLNATFSINGIMYIIETINSQRNHQDFYLPCSCPLSHR